MYNPILTAKLGTNADLFPDILRLYVPEKSIIVDPTYGKGGFWKKIPEGKYQLRATDIKMGVDLKDLPYDDGSIDALVLDPPYAHGSQNQNILPKLAKLYNLTSVCGRDEISNLYLDGVKEALRVLKEDSILIVKCQDEIESGKQYWNHISFLNEIEELGPLCVDIFILIQCGKPAMRHKYQIHARKNHSYFLVFQCGKGLRPKGAAISETTLSSWGVSESEEEEDPLEP